MSGKGERSVDRSGRAIGLALAAGCVVLLSLLFVSGCGGGSGDASAATTTTTQAPLPLKNDTCLGCHKDFLAKTASENQKVFSHNLHVAQRIACVTCHQDIGHGGAALPDNKVCRDCHGMDMPHPAGFQKTHGNLVDKQGAKMCERCHNVTLHCQECHGLQMPHPAEWRSKHGAIARPEMDFCVRCHEKSFCLTCHPVEMPHPLNWTATHGLTVNAKGSTTCTMCHKPDYCVSCHGLPMPHPMNWGTEHGKEAAKSAKDKENCLLCHTQVDCDKCHAIHKSHGKGGGA